METEAQPNPVLDQLLVGNELHDRVRGRLSARLSEPSLRGVNSVDDRLRGPRDAGQATQGIIQESHAAFDVGRGHGRVAQPQAAYGRRRSWTSLAGTEEERAGHEGHAAPNRLEEQLGGRWTFAWQL